MKRIVTILLAIILVLATFATTAFAADFPDHNINMIVPFGAGGATDLICRTLAAEMEKELGVSIAVTNMPGSASAIGQEYVFNECDGFLI